MSRWGTWDGKCTICGGNGDIFPSKRRQCVNCRRAYMRKISNKYYYDNIDMIKLKVSVIRASGKFREREREYANRKYREDTQFRLKLLLRTRLNLALKNSQKAGSAVSDLGCSIDEFKLYLENQFHSGMSWKNQGAFWDIDHVIPISHFDLTNRMEFLEACSYLNMQPMLSSENRVKGNRVNG